MSICGISSATRQGARGIMEPIERDVRNVLHVRRQPNLHPTTAAFAFGAAAHRSATEVRCV
jgi:hypothetical protein